MSQDRGGQSIFRQSEPGPWFGPNQHKVLVPLAEPCLKLHLA